MVQQYRSFNNGSSSSSSSCVPPLENFVTSTSSLQRSGERTTSLMATNSSSVLKHSTNTISLSSTSSGALVSSISARPRQPNRVKKFLSSKTSCVTIVLVTFMVMFFSTDQDEFHYSSFRQLISKKESCNQSSKLRFVGFWHIGNANSNKNSDNSNDQQETGDHIASTSPGSRDEFVLGQLEEIKSAHLFNECNNYDVTLNYVATANLSEQTKQTLSDDPRIHELPPTRSIESIDDNEEYFEFPTLMELHSFCVNLPPEDEEDVVVFYLHTKSNDNWRRWMENYLMGEECVQCLEDPSMMACGPSLIDDPNIWQHFSGNFFMTRCQHVRQLNPPYTSKILDEIHDIQKASKNDKVSGYPHAYPPYGRYAAEYWVMNDAGERPEHDKHASEWPNLHNNHTQYRPPVINSKQICFRHAPHSVVSGEDKVQTLLNWDSTLYDEEKN